MIVIIRLQEDMVCLSCTGTGERVCLSAEGFGNRQCFLESIADRVSSLIPCNWSTRPTHARPVVITTFKQVVRPSQKFKIKWQSLLVGTVGWPSGSLMTVSCVSLDFKLTLFVFFQNIPPDLSQCVFVIEQALSVRALQELVTSSTEEAVRIDF